MSISGKKWLKTSIVNYTTNISSSADRDMIKTMDLAVMARRGPEAFAGGIGEIQSAGTKVAIYIDSNCYNSRDGTYNLANSNTPDRYANAYHYQDSGNPHPGGARNPNETWFLHNASGGARQENKAYADAAIMNYGLTAYQDWFAIAIGYDIFGGHAWSPAEYVWVDNLVCGNNSSFPLTAGTSSEYTTEAAWNTAMESMCNYLADYIDANHPGKGVIGNRGTLLWDNTVTSWNVVAAQTKPMGQCEERAFIWRYGGTTSNPARWTFQDEFWNTVDGLLAGARDDAVIMSMNHGKAACVPGMSGKVDPWGNSMSWYDVQAYAMGGCALAASPSLHISWTTADDGYTSSPTYRPDLWDLIDLGEPVSAYTKTVNPAGGFVGIREFALGYVIANPDVNALSGYDLGETVRPLTEANYTGDQSAITPVSTVSVPRMRAAFFLKETPDTVPTSGNATRTGVVPTGARTGINTTMESGGTTGFNTAAGASHVWLINRGLANTTMTVAGTDHVVGSREGKGVAVAGAVAIALTSGAGPVHCAECD